MISRVFNQIPLLFSMTPFFFFCCGTSLFLSFVSSHIYAEASRVEASRVEAFSAQVKQPVSDRDNFEIKFQNGLLSIKAELVSLQNILKSMSKVAGFDLTMHGSFDEIVAFEFNGMPLLDALKKITRNKSMFISMDHANNSSGRTLQVKSVVLFSSHNDTVTNRPLDIEADTFSAFEELNSTGIQYTGKKLDELTLVLDQGGSAAYEALLPLLSDPDVTRRSQALEALVRVNSQRAIQDLGQILLGDSSELLRLQALKILMYSNHSAAKAFVELAGKDESQAVSRLARDAISL